MAKPPAVVMVARHGMRLDAADQSWHMSTPTPYDPPLTYGGWNQCRALGMRIAGLLHAREQELSNASQEASPNKRKKRKHRVVIHTSPFLRCVQTSIAISAGIAQYQPAKDSSGRPSSGRTRVSTQLHSASPRLRTLDGAGSLHSLTPIIEPRYDLSNGLPKRLQSDSKRYRKSKLRVDAFLGEWLNPSYFEHITPPPPTSMMVAAAKAELLQSDAVDIYTPSMPVRSNGGSLWSPSVAATATPPAPPSASSRESALDDMSPMSDTLPAPLSRRDRGSSVSSVGSNDSTSTSSGRKSPFRPGHVLQPFHSTLARDSNQTSAYIPPSPTYAVSASDNIPRGYVTHARNACTDVDIHWDSSRPPQGWGDGGEYGEEWSEMHRRFRRGLNDLVEWYGEHSIDDSGDDSVRSDSVRVTGDAEDEEDLVVVLVSHAAGSNALIGALTGQPVLLDVGMASLTMAVRRDDAQTRHTANHDRLSPDGNAYGERRRSSVDFGLSMLYDMKLMASSDHLRPGSDPNRPGSIFNSRRATVDSSSKSQTSSLSGLSEGHGASTGANGRFVEPGHGTTSTALGTIRRPSAPTNVDIHEPVPGRLKKSNTTPSGFGSAPTTPLSFSTGLWTPPAARSSPLTSGQTQPKDGVAGELNGTRGVQQARNPSNTMVASETAGSYIDAKPVPVHHQHDRPATNGALDKVFHPTAADGGPDADAAHDADGLGALPSPDSILLKQSSLWAAGRTSGDRVSRRFGEAPKRRWTVVEDQ